MTAGEPFRLALFAEQGHPAGSFRSGVTRLTSHVVRACRTAAVEVDFFTYHDTSGTDDEGLVRYHRVRPRLPATFHGLRVDALDILPLVNGRFRTAARGRRFDCVLATSPGIGTQGQLLARARAVPFAAVYTTDLPHYADALVRAGLGRLPGGAALGRWAAEGAWAYLRWLYGRARTDLVLVPTEAARRDFLERVDAHAEILGRGSDTLPFPEAPSAPGAQPTRLLYVGRIDYGQKNLAVLETVVRSVPGCTLVVVGDGDHLPTMRNRLAREAAAGRVHFTGRVDDPERLVDLYRSADVFVFPSLFDTLGQVVLEAQRAGLPVVVRDRGGPPGLIRHGETGFVTESDEAFVDRTRELVRDESLRTRMGAAARTHAAALPIWDDVTRRLLTLLRELTLHPRAR